MKSIFKFLVLVILVFGLALLAYFMRGVKNPQPFLDKIPASKPHQHVTPDGESIEHTHTYDLNYDTPKLYVHVPTDTSKVTKHPIQLEWENIDHEMVRKKYQPYTVPEMKAMWFGIYQNKFGQNYQTKLDKAYPQEKWLKQNLQLGQPLTDYSDYRLVMKRRIYMVNRRDLWRVAGREDKKAMRNSLQLPEYIDTWKEYENAYLKFWIVASYESFLADKTESVYIQVINENSFSKFKGAKLNRKDKYDLMVYGSVPDSIHVIYHDSTGEPLPSKVKPRYFERYLRELEQAQVNVDKMIVDHKAFFVSHNTKGKRKPTKLTNPEAFSLLQDLHWKDFPKDLKALKNAVINLERIQRDGKERM